MGIFSRMKRAIKSKANSAIDSAIDPEKEIDMAILELEEQRKAAYKDLLSYKTTAKSMEQDIEKLEKKAADMESKAMRAVKAGDDELAKTCLREKKNALAELVKVKADRDEASGYAIELNRSRKKVETRLKMLKLRKGTMAQQIAAARGKGVFDGSEDLFDKLEDAGDRIDDDAIMAEVETAIDGEDPSTAQLEAELLSAEDRVDNDDALAQLKAKMEADKERKQLKE